MRFQYGFRGTRVYFAEFYARFCVVLPFVGLKNVVRFGFLTLTQILEHAYYRRTRLRPGVGTALNLVPRFT